MDLKHDTYIVLFYKSSDTRGACLRLYSQFHRRKTMIPFCLQVILGILMLFKSGRITKIALDEWAR
jgi:hypothetical protein